MKRLTVGLALVAASSVLPSAARAYNFDNYCIMGSFQVCASVRVFTQAGGNELVMQVWNLQGPGGLGIAHTITSIGLYHLTSVPSRVEIKNVLFNGTEISSYWSVQGSNDIKTLAGINLQLRAGTSGNSGINGCTRLPGGTKWQTCDSFPSSPYVQFTFKKSTQSGTTGSFVIGDSPELRWHSQQLPGGGSLKCDTGGAGDYPPCSVVPEPLTMVLLGTGLAGVGAAALRRRRKGSDVTNT